MAQFTLSVRGGQVRQGVKILGEALPGVSWRMLGKLLDNLKFNASGGYAGGSSYRVPSPAGSRYSRTGRYGSGFRVVSTGNKGYRLEATASYSPYVGGDSRGYGQAVVHRGRWPIIAETIRDGAQALIAETRQKVKASRTIEALARNLGIGL